MSPIMNRETMSKPSGIGTPMQEAEQTMTEEAQALGFSRRVGG
jgi:hypothetical protein